VNRATLSNSLNRALQQADQYGRDAAAGQNDLFGFAAAQVSATPVASYDVVDEWRKKDVLEAEKETLGLYLSGHPYDEFEQELRQLVSFPLAKVRPGKQSVTIAGLVVAIRTMKTKRGDTMAFLTLDDKTGRMEVAIFADMYQQHLGLIGKDRILLVSGEISEDSYSGGLKMTVKKIADIVEARQQHVRCLLLIVDSQQAVNGFNRHLQDAISPYRDGSCAVRVRYRLASASVAGDYHFPDQWRVRPTEDLLFSLRKLLGPDAVKLEYK